MIACLREQPVVSLTPPWCALVAIAQICTNTCDLNHSENEGTTNRMRESALLHCRSQVLALHDRPAGPAMSACSVSRRSSALTNPLALCLPAWPATALRAVLQRSNHPAPQWPSLARLRNMARQLMVACQAQKKRTAITSPGAFG
jgi:hypothetical protein